MIPCLRNMSENKHCLTFHDRQTFLSLPADERDAIQKKTFTKWINNHLRKAGGKVTDLFQDLRDGQSLLTLLELLSNEKLVSSIINISINQRLIALNSSPTHSRARKAKCVSTCCKMWTPLWDFSSERMSSWSTSVPMTSPTEIRNWHSDSYGQSSCTFKWVFRRCLPLLLNWGC